MSDSSFGNQTGGSVRSLSSDAQYDELLAEFVRLFPNVQIMPESPEFDVLYLYDDAGDCIDQYFFNIGSDSTSAEALVLLLDWLEGQGYLWQWFSKTIDGGWNLTLRFNGGQGPVSEGKTRIEAVLKAVVAVLKEKK